MLFARLESLEQILFVHPGPVSGLKPAWWAPGVVYAAQMQEAYASWLADGTRRWPRLRVVFAMLAGGAPFQIERLIRRGLDPGAPFGPTIWFETSSYGERALELTLQTFGVGRLLFGSDAPIDSVAGARAVLAGFGPALETELIATNPSSLFSSEAGRWAA